MTISVLAKDALRRTPLGPLLASVASNGPQLLGRLYQEQRDEVVVQVVKGPEFSDQDIPALRAELDQWMSGRLKIFIEFCERLEQTQGGKYQIRRV